MVVMKRFKTVSITGQKKKVPLNITSAEDLRQYQDIVDCWMQEMSGMFYPYYFYQVTAANRNKSYLLGTSHVVDPVVFDKRIYNHIKKCNLFVTEVQMVSIPSALHNDLSEEKEQPEYKSNLFRFF